LLCCCLGHRAEGVQCCQRCLSVAAAGVLRYRLCPLPPLQALGWVALPALLPAVPLLLAHVLVEVVVVAESGVDLVLLPLLLLAIVGPSLQAMVLMKQQTAHHVPVVMLC